MLIKLFQNDISIDIFSDLDDNTCTFTAGLITDCRDAVYLFIPYEICDLLDHICLIYHIRQLCNYDLSLAVGKSLYIGYSADKDLAASCTVCFLDTSCTKDLCTGREVRSMNYGHKLINGSFPSFFYAVVDDLYDCTDDLP